MIWHEVSAWLSAAFKRAGGFPSLGISSSHVTMTPGVQGTRPARPPCPRRPRRPPKPTGTSAPVAAGRSRQVSRGHGVLAHESIASSMPPNQRIAAFPHAGRHPGSARLVELGHEWFSASPALSTSAGGGSLGDGLHEFDSSCRQFRDQVQAHGPARPKLRRWQVVGEGGVEPPRPCGHRNLNPARLPIPPLARGGTNRSSRPAGFPGEVPGRGVRGRIRATYLPTSGNSVCAHPS